MTPHDCHDHAQHQHDLVSQDVLEQASGMFSAMGDPARLRLLELLLQQRHCVSELAAETDASHPAVSNRLKILAAARLVTRTREGKHIYYALADDHVRQVLLEVLDHARE